MFTAESSPSRNRAGTFVCRILLLPTILLIAGCSHLKFNSYGELVFDWSWADAYRRSGMDYYPKLVVASPYTPGNGPRILTEDAAERGRYARALIEGLIP